MYSISYCIIDKFSVQTLVAITPQKFQKFRLTYIFWFSFYEYLLKVWIQGNKTEHVKRYRFKTIVSLVHSLSNNHCNLSSMDINFICIFLSRQMWETSMEGLISLTRKTTPSNYQYICEKNGGSLSDKVKYPYPIDLAG